MTFGRFDGYEVVSLTFNLTSRETFIFPRFAIECSNLRKNLFAISRMLRRSLHFDIHLDVHFRFSVIKTGSRVSQIFLRYFSIIAFVMFHLRLDSGKLDSCIFSRNESWWSYSNLNNYSKSRSENISGILMSRLWVFAFSDLKSDLEV